jgi:hypothetical protein
MISSWSRPTWRYVYRGVRSAPAERHRRRLSDHERGVAVDDPRPAQARVQDVERDRKDEAADEGEAESGAHGYSQASA